MFSNHSFPEGVLYFLTAAYTYAFQMGNMREKEKRLASQRVFLYNEIECFAPKEKTAVF